MQFATGRARGDDARASRRRGSRQPGLCEPGFFSTGCEVGDTTPPEIGGFAVPLWLTGAWAAIRAVVTSADDCGDPSVTLEAISGGPFLGAAVGTADFDFLLMRGLFYYIVYAATDASGNTSRHVITVLVP